MGYIGNEPTTGHFPVDNFTSSGGSTYTLAKAPASAGAIEVSVQGALQPTTAYTVSGTTLTMAGVTSGVKIFVRHLGETLTLPTIADGVVTGAKMAVNSVDGTKIAMGSDARGDILYHGATDYARLAKGTSGQVLTMGANDPAWAAAAGGSWTMIGSSAVGAGTTAASLTVTGLSTTAYHQYAIGLSRIKSVNDAVRGYLRLGDSSGVDSGASDYTWTISWDQSDSTTHSVSVTAGAAQMRCMMSLANAAGEGGGAMMFLHSGANDNATDSIRPYISGTHTSMSSAGHLRSGHFAGMRNAVINVDRVHFLASAGNLEAGRLTVWGIKHT